jgi:hypothetical protein
VFCDFVPLDVNKEGGEDLLGGKQTNLNNGVVDKLSDWLSKGEIGPTVEAITAPSTTGADFTPLGVNKEGREEPMGGEQMDPNVADPSPPPSLLARRYCLMYGYAIVPCYTFGETDTYSCFPWLLTFRLMLAKQNIPAAAMWGIIWCPFMPRPAELLTFIGEKIELPKIPDPTKDDVKKYHALYVKGVQNLFDKHKAEAGRKDAVLEIF